MTTIKKALLFFLFGASLLFCSFAKAQNCACENVSLNDEEFNRYTTNYGKLFPSTVGNEKHTKWIYLPKSYFLFLDSFLKSPNYQGVRFYFISHNRIIDPNQQSRSDQVMLMMVAGHTDRNMDFDTLFSFHENVSFLRDPKTNHAELSSRRNTNTKRSIIGPDNILLTSHTEMENYRRHNPQKKYSESVYICKDQISQVVEFLNSNTYQGVKLYFASYNEDIPCVKFEVKEQATLVLVPVPDKDSPPVLKVYLDFLMSNNKFKNHFYNHGSLCPNRCPTD